MKSEDKFIKTRDGVALRARVREKGSPVWIVATHGIGEHLGRHQYLSDLFGQDFNIVRYDLRGHGQSGGTAAYIDNFYHYMEDLSEVLAYFRDKFRMKRFVLFGHSMGAQIVSGYLQSYADQDFYPEKVIINAPPISFSGLLGNVVDVLPKDVTRALAKFPFSCKLGGLVDLDNLSHSAQVRIDYERDKLNHLKLHSKLLLEMTRAQKDIFSRPIRPRCPMVCSYGSEDKIVGVAGIERYFDMIEKSVLLKRFDGAFHEIHNEIEKYRKPYFEYLSEQLNEVRYL